MSSSGDDVSVKFGAETSDAVSSLNQIRFAIEGLTDPLRAVRSTLGEVGEAFVAAFAVEKVVQFTEQMAELGLETEKLSEQLGLSSKQVGEFEYAAGSVGVSGQAAGMALERMARGLSESSKAGSPAQQAMNALGIAYKNADGSIRPLNELLPQLADKFASFADGPNKTALAMELFGRSGAQLIPVLDQGSAGLKSLYDAADAAGVVLSGPAVAGMVAVHEAMYNLDAEIRGAGISAFNELQPVILTVVSGLDQFVGWVKQAFDNITSLISTNSFLVSAWDSLSEAVSNLWADISQLVEWFAKIAQQLYLDQVAIVLLQAAWVAIEVVIGTVIVVIESAIATFKILTEAIEFLGETVIDVFSTSGKIISDFFSGDIKQAEADADSGMAKIETSFTTHLANMKKAVDDLQKSMTTLFNGPQGNQGSGIESVTVHGTQPNAPSPTPNDTSKSNEQKQLAQEFMQLEGEKRSAMQETETFQQSLDALDLAQQKSVLEQQLDAGVISKQQYYAKLAQLQSQEVDNNLKALKSEYDAMVQINNDELASTVLTLAQKVKLNEQESQEEIKNIDATFLAVQKGLNQQTQDVTEALAAQKAQWQAYDTQIVDGVGGAFKNMLTSTQSWQQQMTNILDKVVDLFIQQAEKIVVDWLLSEQMKTAATVTGNALRTASDTAAGAASTTAGAEASLASIGKAAGRAAANVYADVSEIPYIGWLLAPPAAAAAFTAVLAFGGTVPSAAGGMVVNEDTMAQIHKDEMVLPASLSQGIQNIISGAAANGSQGGGSSGGGDTYNINVSAIDGQSVQRFFATNSGQIVAALSAQKRNLNPFFTKGAQPT